MGIKVDRKEFWKRYHASFDAYGRTTQATTDALNDILDRFETETRLKYISHYAYVLATSYHETGINGNHFVPVKEGRERASSPRRANQDKYWGTGFYGRGQVQTTWKENYLKLGKGLGVGDMFVKNPDLLLTGQWSYESLVYGLSTGLYRGDSAGRKTLSRYLKSDDATLQQYIDARDVVNGDKAKNGLLIATYAEKFENILKQSQNLGASQDAATDVTPPTKIAPLVSSGESQPPTTTNPEKGTSTNIEQTTVQSSTGESAQSTTVTQEQNVAVEKEPPISTPDTKGFFGTLWAKVTSAFGGAITTDVAVEKAQQAQSLGLSTQTWNFIFWAIIIGLVIYVLYHFVAMKVVPWFKWVLGRIRTHNLMTANSTPTNQVIVVTADQIAEYEAKGWAIVRRS